jgi:hypothetical protein
MQFLGGIVNTVTGAVMAHGNALGDAAGKTNDLYTPTVSLSGVMGGLQTNLNGVHTSAGDAQTAIAELESQLKTAYGITINDADAALYLARGMNAVDIAAQNAAASIRNFNQTHPINPALPGGAADTQRAQAGLPTGGDQAALDQRARINKQIYDEDKAARDKAAADAKSARDQAASDAKRAADQAAADAKRARDKAAADAKAAAADLARAQVAAADDAFTRMGDAAHKYFDALHTANLKAIDDAQKTADAQIEAQKKANQEPATAAEARLRAVQQARQLARLQADLAAAKTPEERLSATQALSDFQAQARIDFLHKQADDANAILDEQKKTQDAAFADRKDAENKRNADQVNLFDENLKSLRDYVSKHPAEWKKSTDGVMRVLKAAGVDFEKAGADNANAYITGVNKAFAGYTTGTAAPGGKGTTAGASPALMASAGLIPVGGGVKGDVYLDGNKVGEFIERYLAANASATTSGYTARHN